MITERKSEVSDNKTARDRGDRRYVYEIGLLFGAFQIKLATIPN
jgi:hypothetical protein